MLWTVLQECPSGSRFFLNCCCHLSLIVLRNGNGADSFLHSRESMNQGYPLAMVAYDIGFIPPIKVPKAAYRGVTQPWYTDNSGVLGMFNNIGLYFNSLKNFSLGRGYYPKSSKTVLIVHPDNITAGKYFVLCHRSKGFHRLVLSGRFYWGCQIQT